MIGSLRLRHRQALRIAAIAWFLLLIAGSLQPVRPSLVKSAHREIHYLTFAGGALLLLCLCQNIRREILAASATLLLGASLEFLQHVIYRNPMEWRDITDDGLAILMALIVYRLAGAWKPAPGLKQ